MAHMIAQLAGQVRNLKSLTIISTDIDEQTVRLSNTFTSCICGMNLNFGGSLIHTYISFVGLMH